MALGMKERKNAAVFPEQNTSSSYIYTMSDSRAVYPGDLATSDNFNKSSKTTDTSNDSQDIESVRGKQ